MRLDDSRNRFFACGCDAFVRKPFLAEELFAILERQAGLTFLRAGHPRARDDRLDPAAVASRLGACPPDWRAALKSAVDLSDFARITTLLDQRRGADAALDAVLAGWPYDFDQAGLACALAGAGDLSQTARICPRKTRMKTERELRPPRTPGHASDRRVTECHCQRSFALFAV